MSEGFLIYFSPLTFFFTSKLQLILTVVFLIGVQCAFNSYGLPAQAVLAPL